MAGESAKVLVDYAKITGKSLPKTGSEDAPVGGRLIERFIAATQAGDADTAGKLLEEINRVLDSSGTGGLASQTIERARSLRTAVYEGVRARLKEFQDKLPGYEEAPDLMLQRLWAEVRERVLDLPLTEKYYLPAGDQKIVLRIGRDPDIRNQIEQTLRKLKQFQQDEARLRGGGR